LFGGFASFALSFPITLITSVEESNHIAEDTAHRRAGKPGS
jgi:hypothetical protein